MKLVALISLLALVSLANAFDAADYPWITFSGMAITIAAGMIALGYMLSYLINAPGLKAWASEEIYQVIATGMLLFLITGGIIAVDGSAFFGIKTKYIAEALSEDYRSSNLMLAAKVATVRRLNEAAGLFGSAQAAANSLGSASSQSGYCSFLGVGYSITTCSAMNAGRGMMANAMNAAALAVADLRAQHFLLMVGDKFAMAFLFPLGIFLRSFHATRAAGGALLAVALSLYIVLPLVVVFNEGAYKAAAEAYAVRNPGVNIAAPLAQPPIGCNPFKMSEGEVTSLVSTLLTPGYLEPIVFRTIIGALFLTTVAIFATLTAIRALASFFGAEIDVASLAKIS